MDQVLSDVCYRKNYLVDVVARIDFIESIKSLSGIVLPEDVQRTVKERYKIYEPSKETIQGIEISDKGVSTQQEEYHKWTYHGEEREKTINICKKSVDVSIKRYKNYDEFKLDVVEPIKKIAGVEGDVYVARTGLRFVNIFSGVLNAFEDVENYFSPMLSGQFKNLTEAASCSRSFLISEYLYDDIKLRLQTGIYNPDYPAKIKKLDFIVDIDAYIDAPHPFGDVGRLLDELHAVIQRHFEAAITEKMRGLLNEQA